MHACADVDAELLAAVLALCVLVAQARQHVRGVEARVVTQLPGDDLQGTRVGVDKHLRLARYRARVLPARARQQKVFAFRPDSTKCACLQLGFWSAWTFACTANESAGVARAVVLEERCRHHLRALLSSMSMAPPPATTLEFFSARRTIMMASCSERSASSRNYRGT